MQSILELIEQKKRELAASPFLTFMQDRSVDPRQRLSFLPCMAPWALGFTDVNKYVLRDESSQDPIQKMINVHTQEDESHWGMYLRDLRTLGMNDTMDFCSALRMLWSDECKKARQAVYGLTGLIAAANSVMRLVIVEAIEAAGNQGFKGFIQASQEYRELTGEQLYYFGETHLELESGHAMGTEDVETKIQEVKLSPEQEKEAAVLVSKVFQYVMDMGDEFLAYAKRHPRSPITRTAEPVAAGQQAK